MIILMFGVFNILPQGIGVSPRTVQAGDGPTAILISYLPMVTKLFPGDNIFGAEITQYLQPGSMLTTRAQELGIGQFHLNDQVSWRQLQPNQGDPIDWALLTDFETELNILRSIGFTPIVVLDDYPAWATDNSARSDGQPTSCGPLRDDRLADFASFVQALVTRYSAPEFNVHDWELGNEPDIDPNLVAPNNPFGCWGDVEDYYYGGERYGRMVIAIGAAIKAIDPSATVWLGGLLLNQPDSDLYPPNCGLPDCGHSERFFQGILASGAAPYFDVVPYHYAPPYLNQVIDYDTNYGVWVDWGGGYLGKARFLRGFMTQYEIDRPVYINETSLTCPDDIVGITWCSPPANDFYQMQADFLVRSYVRGLSEDISGYSWYSLNEAEWRYTSLLDSEYNRKPAFVAYRQLISTLQGTTYVGTYTYGTGIEAHYFDDQSLFIHVIWSTTDTIYTITVPQLEFVAAYTRDGVPIIPTPSGPDYQLPVQFEPIYLIRTH